MESTYLHLEKLSLIYSSAIQNQEEIVQDLGKVVEVLQAKGLQCFVE